MRKNSFKSAKNLTTERNNKQRDSSKSGNIICLANSCLSMLDAPTVTLSMLEMSSDSNEVKTTNENRWNTKHAIVWLYCRRRFIHSKLFKWKVFT